MGSGQISAGIVRQSVDGNTDRRGSTLICGDVKWLGDCGGVYVVDAMTFLQTSVIGGRMDLPDFVGVPIGDWQDLELRTTRLAHAHRS
jgi:hypothetical protein